MEANIDRFDETPRFLQLVRIVAGQIDDELWLPHQAILTERQLCEEFNLSRTTVRRAIEKLIDMFYLYRIHGKGTFVSPRQLREFRQASGMGFQEHALNRGQVPSQDILSLGKVPITKELRERIDLSTDVTELWKVVRLFYLDNKLDSHNSSYLPLPEGSSITREEIEDMGSLYAVLRNKFNYIPYITCQEFVSMKAIEEIANYL